MKSLLACLVAVFSQSSLHAAPQLFSRWAVELIKPTTALERFQEYRVGGLAANEDSFFLANPYGELQRRNLESGGLIWSTKLEGVSQSLWKLDGDKVFGGDTKGNIYGVRVSDGKILWKASTKGVFFAAPIIQGADLFIMNSLGTVQAYEKETGTWKWQQTDPSIASVNLWSAQGPLAIGNELVAGFPSALLQAMNPSTGQVVWKESFSALPSGADSINDLKAVTGNSNLLFASSFGGDMKVWSLKPGVRKVLWQKNLSLYAPPSLSNDGVLYVVTKDGALEAFDAETGYSKWRKQLPGGLGTSVTIDGNHLWLGTSEGQVLVYSKNGDLLAKTNYFESAIWNSPLVFGKSDALVVTSQGILRKFHFNAF